MKYTLLQCQEIIRQKMEQFPFDSLQPKELYEPLHYTFQNGGKRLRPALTLLSCNIFSDQVDMALPAALAIEVFHNFTLLHDDVMDKADIRRGKPTIHKKWNENVAILSGDVMMIKAYDLLLETDEKVLPEILKVFNETATQICEGQQLDMNFESRTDVTIQEYLRMIELKTSVLLACAMKIGGIIGGAGTNDSHKLYEFGRKLGMSFQLQDDLLDTYSDPHKFGKRIGGDIVANKKTFLLLSALEKADKNKKNQLLHLLNSNDDEQEKIEQVKNIFDDLGIKEITQQKIMLFFNEAVAAFESLEVSKNDKTELLDLAHQMVKRDY
ncbi:MAG: polyprenyl synthetase family protein [Bacteroidetes bacterium]|jgi:geranylgeranyl diphosphate synthase type II|nr:polyprenyl synthetase family protein [Bacteroidota bacterium]